MTALQTVEKERREIRDVHERIVADIEHICTIANVPPKFVRESMKYYCTAEDVEWVRAFNVNRKNGVAGLTIESPNAEIRCMAITGTLVRNFVDARLLSLNTVIDNVDAALKPTVLVVPNFYIRGLGTQLTSWQVQTLYDVLLSRFAASRPTVLCFDNFEKLGEAYGETMAGHLREHFHPA